MTYDIKGLSESEVNERHKKGQSNFDDNRITKSYARIFKDNLFTFFNILNAIFVILLAIAGAYTDIAFVIIVVFNLVIGIVQEISAKKTLDKLSVVVQKSAKVIRDGVLKKINASDLVLDDIIVLESGAQVSADGIVLSGEIEVNESLLTGESDVVNKRNGDSVLSGSFVVSGKAYIQVNKVGSESYANKISIQAKAQKSRNSKLMHSVNIIIKTVSAIIIPVSVLVFTKQWAVTGLDIKSNIVSTVASAIGMVPEGLVLLTSMALAASIVILAYKKILIQDLYSVENIARIDTLCVDKTGTLTQGTLHVSNVVRFYDFDNMLKNLLGRVTDNNATYKSLVDEFGTKNDLDCTYVSSFSSARKYSCASFSNVGSIFVGAHEILFDSNLKELSIDNQQLIGKRIISVGVSDQVVNDNSIPKDLNLAGLIIIDDKLRENAKETLDFFAAQGISLKIISGDSIDTVEEIAGELGIDCRSVDMSSISEPIDYNTLTDFNIFCRVLPDQKKELVMAIKAKNHSVGMIGDGVNDVLALKKADCSISIANGSEAARNISDIVLLESDFSHLPSAVNEGRKVINNIQRVATLFFTKTLYSIFIVLLTLIIPSCIYPFSPLQLTVLSFITIGFPAFFLSFEPDFSAIKGGFLTNILRKSLPGALCVLIAIFLVNLVFNNSIYSYPMISTISFILIGIIGMYVYIRVAWPFSVFRWIIFGVCIFMLVGSLAFEPIRNFLGFTVLDFNMNLFILLTTVALPFVFIVFEKVSHKLARFVVYLIKKKRHAY